MLKVTYWKKNGLIIYRADTRSPEYQRMLSEIDFIFPSMLNVFHTIKSCQSVDLYNLLARLNAAVPFGGYTSPIRNPMDIDLLYEDTLVFLHPEFAHGTAIRSNYYLKDIYRPPFEITKRIKHGTTEAYQDTKITIQAESYDRNSNIQFLIHGTPKIRSVLINGKVYCHFYYMNLAKCINAMNSLEIHFRSSEPISFEFNEFQLATQLNIREIQGGIPPVSIKHINDDPYTYTVIEHILISLRCPLTKSRIKQAAIGINCSHQQCFDMVSYLQDAFVTDNWKCPLCNIFLPVSDVRKVKFMQEIVLQHPDAESIVFNTSLQTIIQVNKT